MPAMPRSPTPDPEPVTLDHAIESSHPERLVETLIAVCEKSAEAKTIVSGLLLSDIKPETIKDAGKKETLAGKKRKRWEACETCHEEFDVEDNGEGSCKWHKGELEKNEDAAIWKDGSIEIDEDVDPEDLVEEYPEAIRFTCCKKLGDAEGCSTGKHRIISVAQMAKFAKFLNGDGEESEGAPEEEG